MLSRVFNSSVVEVVGVLEAVVVVVAAGADVDVVGVACVVVVEGVDVVPEES